MKNSVILREMEGLLNRDNLVEKTKALLSLYKNKREIQIKRIYQSLPTKYKTAGEKPHNVKIFTALVKHYHPDRLGYYNSKAREWLELEDENSLRHLLDLLKIRIEFVNDNSFPADRSNAEPTNRKTHSYADESDEDYAGEFYKSEYRTDFSEDDFDSVYDSEDSRPYDEYFENSEAIHDFIAAIRYMDESLKSVEITPSILELFDGELDLSGYEMDDLSGIEYCTNIEVLNLSGNNLNDIDLIAPLTGLVSLFISENEIDDITVLKNLKGLKELDLSFNSVHDISPLFELENLEYVNLIGNPVNESQCAILEGNGVVVIR